MPVRYTNSSSGGSAIAVSASDRFSASSKAAAESARDAAYPTPTSGKYVVVVDTSTDQGWLQKYEGGSWIDYNYAITGSNGTNGTNGTNGDNGADGETREIRYQYSPDGTTWHDSPMLDDDEYRREALFVDGTIDGTWSVGNKFGSASLDPSIIVQQVGDTKQHEDGSLSIKVTNRPLWSAECIGTGGFNDAGNFDGGMAAFRLNTTVPVAEDARDFYVYFSPKHVDDPRSYFDQSVIYKAKISKLGLNSLDYSNDPSLNFASQDDGSSGGTLMSTISTKLGEGSFDDPDFHPVVHCYEYCGVEGEDGVVSKKDIYSKGINGMTETRVGTATISGRTTQLQDVGDTQIGYTGVASSKRITGSLFMFGNGDPTVYTLIDGSSSTAMTISPSLNYRIGGSVKIHWFDLDSYDLQPDKTRAMSFMESLLLTDSFDISEVGAITGVAKVYNARSAGDSDVTLYSSTLPRCYGMIGNPDGTKPRIYLLEQWGGGSSYKIYPSFHRDIAQGESLQVLDPDIVEEYESQSYSKIVTKLLLGVKLAPIEEKLLEIDTNAEAITGLTFDKLSVTGGSTSGLISAPLPSEEEFGAAIFIPAFPSYSSATLQNHEIYVPMVSLPDDERITTDSDVAGVPETGATTYPLRFESPTTPSMTHPVVYGWRSYHTPSQIRFSSDPEGLVPLSVAEADALAAVLQSGDGTNGCKIFLVTPDIGFDDNHFAPLGIIKSRLGHSPIRVDKLSLLEGKDSTPSVTTSEKAVIANLSDSGLNLSVYLGDSEIVSSAVTIASGSTSSVRFDIADTVWSTLSSDTAVSVRDSDTDEVYFSSICMIG